MPTVPAALNWVSEAACAVAATVATRLVLALVILAGGVFLSRWAARAISLALAETGRIDETARPALASAARYAILILTSSPP